jgi:hypothetical protein
VQEPRLIVPACSVWMMGICPDLAAIDLATVKAHVLSKGNALILL